MNLLCEILTDNQTKNKHFRTNPDGGTFTCFWIYNAIYYSELFNGLYKHPFHHLRLLYMKTALFNVCTR